MDQYIEILRPSFMCICAKMCIIVHMLEAISRGEMAKAVYQPFVVFSNLHVWIVRPCVLNPGQLEVEILLGTSVEEKGPATLIE